MTNYQAVSKSEYYRKKWKRYTNYLFASRDPVAEIAYEEIDRAATRYPLAFIKSDTGFCLGVVLGLETGQNLFVDNHGDWSVDYVPAVYRAYPFSLMTDGSDQHVVCVDVDSGLADVSSGEDYFDENGKPSVSLGHILKFLIASEHGLQNTRKICSILDHFGLIESWQLKIQFGTGERNISDLYRINMTRLDELMPGELIELRDNGALRLAYAQSISIQNMYTLGKLLEQYSIAESSLHGKSSASEVQFLIDNEVISFDEL